MARKVLFLDFDGVLNDNAWFETEERKNLEREYKRRDKALPPTESEIMMKLGLSDIRPQYAARVREIVDRTGCEVIVCSAWRYTFTAEQIRSLLQSQGIPCNGVVAQTRRRKLSDLRDYRVSDIKAVVSTFVGKTNWCVLDDSVNASDVDGRAVTPVDGVTPDNVEEVVRILNNTDTE
jgi:hypothetical protein